MSFDRKGGIPGVGGAYLTSGVGRVRHFSKKVNVTQLFQSSFIYKKITF